MVIVFKMHNYTQNLTGHQGRQKMVNMTVWVFNLTKLNSSRFCRPQRIDGSSKICQLDNFWQVFWTQEFGCIQNAMAHNTKKKLWPLVHLSLQCKEIILRWFFSILSPKPILNCIYGPSNVIPMLKYGCPSLKGGLDSCSIRFGLSFTDKSP